MTRLGRGRRKRKSRDWETASTSDPERTREGSLPPLPALVGVQNQRTRNDGGAGYFAIHYEYPGGPVGVFVEAYQVSFERFLTCRDMHDVRRVVQDILADIPDVKDSAFRLRKGESSVSSLQDFMDLFTGSSERCPLDIFCRARGTLVPDTTPRVRDVAERYGQYAPSSMNAKNVRKVQIPEGSELGPLYKCGRPIDAAGLEAPLMHPVFGSFVQNLRNSSLPTREDYNFVREFCQASSKFYKLERERQDALFSYLSTYLKRTVGPKKTNKFEVEGYIGHQRGFPVLSIIEVENELGSTTVDKFFQGQRYYADFCLTAQDSSDSSAAIFTSCNCPVFLVEFRGVQMRVSAMAYLDRVHTSMLTDLVNLSWPSENLPHIFKSLKLGIDSLDKFYDQVVERRITSTRGDWLEKVVPYPVWWNPRYHFKEVLFKSRGSEKPTFLAEDDQKRTLFIKFSRGYGDKVHKAWYNAGFAPELLDVEELAGGFKMVAMEYLGPPWQMLVELDTETKERARVVVRQALQEVQKLRVFDSTNAGSVHGDVRDGNIMKKPTGSSSSFL